MNQAAINPLPVPTPYHPLWVDSRVGDNAAGKWYLLQLDFVASWEFLLGAVISHPLLLQEGGIWCRIGQLFSVPFPVYFHPFLPLFSLQH